MKFMDCLPSKEYPVAMRTVACKSFPAVDAMTVPGPEYDVMSGQQGTESGSECLRQSTLIIAAILAFVFAYMQL